MLFVGPVLDGLGDLVSFCTLQVRASSQSEAREDNEKLECLRHVGLIQVYWNVDGGQVRALGFGLAYATSQLAWIRQKRITLLTFAKTYSQDLPAGPGS